MSRARVDPTAEKLLGDSVGREDPAEMITSPGASGECLLEDELLDYQGGRCSQTQLARVDTHLDSCPSCQELVHHYVHGAERCFDADVSAASSWLTTFAQGDIVNSRYHIRRFVGRGGMGEVYEAFDHLMGTRVALKTVICTASDKPRAVRNLMDEVRNAQRIAHPNVCRINELQEHQDVLNGGPKLPFFTMEFLDGERLGNRLRRGLLPLEEARVIAHQLLAGLGAAHARGVLHLDFKSDNVMLRRGGLAPDAVIMDFGLSRAFDNDCRQRPIERIELAGTLRYMSLEQLECRPVLGPAADVYSFGVALYEMLTGRLPFETGSLRAMRLQQLRQRPPPPSRFARRIAPALDRFVLQCLSSDPARRYPDAGRALAALEHIRSWEATGELRLRPWKLLVPLALATLLITIGTRLAHLWATSPNGAPPPSTQLASAAPASLTAANAIDAVGKPEAPAPGSARAGTDAGF